MPALRVCLLLMFLAPPVFAAPPPQATAEIEHLIKAMGRSGCDFERNGAWHPAKKAETHLRRKYDYLRERDKVASAEEFIALAGSRSSMSGRTYRVRCAGLPVMDSADWLRARLRELRKAAPGKTGPGKAGAGSVLPR